MRLARVLGLLLLGYVVLDVASPLVPGVFQFVDGSVEVVQADRTRTGAEAPTPPIALPTWFAVIPAATFSLMQRPRQPERVRRRLSRLLRRPPAPRRDPDRSDDH